MKKRKMQQINFNTIDDFLDFLPEEELKIVEFLRQIILDCMPDCIEKLSYNVPYYRRHSNVCFIWPASIKWGNSENKGVRLGFTNGNLLSDDIDYLEKGERKQVYWKDFMSLKEIDTDLLKSYIFEALVVDEERAKAKNIKKHKLN
ncbi:DUF1801 domain-containing protein [Fulvivirgaceae bacterium BMA10]|uniref:DUF1801 domain-containing protein n=1 Tax=Splendidivirga corallicola TaxID=3051826 RepID=A0ABT8KIK4_9BACT|nr:DUF1801 domain-containing protein [Fulvivirgaceae bacterium BMA10]